MSSLVWLVLAAIAAAGAWLALRARRKWREREQAEAERFAAFMAASAAAKEPAQPPIAPAPLPARPAAENGLAQQKLLFDAAHKAGEAGEPALAIQLYGRLLGRYPATAFAGQARAAVESLKKKLVKT